MNKIGKIQDIESIFTNKNSLLDTSLDEILISKDGDGELQIELSFSNFREGSDFEVARICFKEIEEFCFTYSSDYNFYNIEGYKLMKVHGKIYISLDPNDSVESRSKEDLDYILSGKATILK